MNPSLLNYIEKLECHYNRDVVVTALMIKTQLERAITEIEAMKAPYQDFTTGDIPFEKSRVLEILKGKSIWVKQEPKPSS